MAYCCSQCSFTAQFESALMMHRQLHHDATTRKDFPEPSSLNLKTKSSTIPRVSPPPPPFLVNKIKEFKLPTRTSSATRLLGKLKARICKSRTLFAHPEVPESSLMNNLSARSDCTSKAMKAESLESGVSDITACMEDQKETYRCHLCNFEADRITVLDRHLLNLHKIGLENLLKLVMAKTKDGLYDGPNSNLYGINQPYYKPENEIVEDGEFIIETVQPKIKILKHASTNTDHDNFNETSLEKNCQYISKELESLINGEKKYGNEVFFTKMQTLNEYMCKFVQSSDALKKVLAKEFDGNVKERLNMGEPFFNLGLGEKDTSRNWERAHSEKMERTRNKYGENCRSDKPKQSAESFYF